MKFTGENVMLSIENEEINRAINIGKTTNANISGAEIITISDTST